MNARKKFIGWNFFIYLGASYVTVNLYINDKLRADIKKAIESGRIKEKLHSIHENAAGSYEKKTNNFEFRNQFNKYRRVLLSYAYGDVLECGVGTGRSLEFYKEPVRELIAIDYSPKMLDQAHAKLADRKHARVPDQLKVILKEMDCESLKENFPEKHFDTVVDFNNFHCYNDHMKVYDGIKYVLKDEGIFLFLARGKSDYVIINEFYKMWSSYIFMKFGMDLNKDWSELIENDKDWEIMYKNRKNYGRTYLYILKKVKQSN